MGNELAAMVCRNSCSGSGGSPSTVADMFAMTVCANDSSCWNSRLGREIEARLPKEEGTAK